jgi:hypothetical protein
MEGAKLLLVFLITLLIGQSISIGAGLLVERYVSPYTGLVTFMACYFTMFWVVWRLAVRKRHSGGASRAEKMMSFARADRRVTATAR